MMVVTIFIANVENMEVKPSVIFFHASLKEPLIIVEGSTVTVECYFHNMINLTCCLNQCQFIYHLWVNADIGSVRNLINLICVVLGLQTASNY